MSNQHSNKVYKIGTRGSLLALTQCEQAKRKLEELTGASFELEVIKTQGDQDTSKPLWQMEGKDFFTKELDEALLSKKIDLVVHSYKDLGSERPQGLHLAAITKRDFAHDIFLIRQEVLEKLQRGEWSEDFVVGTSSPRRITNIESTLADFLPLFPQEKSITTEMLRGNVNTRINKLKRGDFHGIVLAMAGLERLAKEEEPREELKKLLEGLNYAILPQRAFPAAASQGALGIECREDDENMKKLLSPINDKETIEEVKRERLTFQKYGGGCHLAVGIHVQKSGPVYVHHQKGQVDGQKIEEHWTESPENETNRNYKLPAFVGMPSGTGPADSRFLPFIYDEMIEKEPIKGIDEAHINREHQLFVTTRYALERLPKNTQDFVFWASGTRTWKLMAGEGHWVHGSSEGLGHEQVQNLSSSHLVRLFQELREKRLNLSLKGFAVLTHEKSDTSLGAVVPSYRRHTRRPTEEFAEKVKSCHHFYWTSGFQAQTYLEHFPELKERSHYCGLGKTWGELKKLGLNPTPVSSPTEFQEKFQS